MGEWRFLTLVSHGGEQSASHTGYFTQGTEPQVPTEQKAKWAPGSGWNTDNPAHGLVTVLIMLTLLLGNGGNK